MDQSPQPTTDADRIRWLYDRRERLSDERQLFVGDLYRLLLEQEREPSFRTAFSRKQIGHLHTVYGDLRLEVEGGKKAVERADQVNSEMLDELLQCTNLSDWELEFVDSLDKQRQADPGRRFSAKQKSVVERIYKNRVLLGLDGRE